ncbi:PLP-dependent aminotransferase family protein [Microbulbifer sp. DLAB2-AF]|uniref:MocR-like pyridoxine biosynthesis transcription factor PdxR n=1 Tax=Microbulbifer sp. DLAB2-AF TaxID=3243395 RepID=UPI004039F7C0
MKLKKFTNLILSQKYPLQKQIYNFIVKLIEDGELLPGNRLPSSRVLAKYLDVSRNTIIQVVEKLKKEGFLVSEAQKGIFINSNITIYKKSKEGIQKVNVTNCNVKSLPGLSSFGESMKRLPLVKSHWSSTLPFSPGLPDQNTFPYDKWQKLYQMHQGRISVSGFGDPRGYAPLREKIAEYLRISRGVHCTKDQVIITNGCMEAVNLCSKVILNHGDSVLIENPGYPRAHQVFSALGANINLVELKNGCTNTDDIKNYKLSGKILYLSPTRQYPTGCIMEYENRVKLLEWATKNNCWILEDDYNIEFSKRNNLVTPLQGLIKNSPTLYMGSFDRILIPSIRLAYLVVPEPVVPAFINIKNNLQGPCPLLYQAILADFMSEGHFIRYIRKMRSLYTDKLNHLCCLIHEHLTPQVKIISKDSVMFIVLLTPGMNDIKIVEELSKYGFGSTALSLCYFGKIEKSGLIIGCANTTKLQRVAFTRRLERIINSKDFNY